MTQCCCFSICSTGKGRISEGTHSDGGRPVQTKRRLLLKAGAKHKRSCVRAAENETGFEYSWRETEPACKDSAEGPSSCTHAPQTQRSTSPRRSAGPVCGAAGKRCWKSPGVEESTWTPSTLLPGVTEFCLEAFLRRSR